MKTILSRITVALLSLNLAFSPLASRTARAEKMSCSDACAKVKLAVEKDGFNCRGNAECAACAQSAKQGMVDKYCTSVDGYETAIAGTNKSAAIDVVPAAVCAVACVAGKTPWGAWTVPVCTGAGVVAALGQIVNMVATTDQMGKDFQGWFSSNAAGVAVLAAKGSVAAGVGKGAATKAGAEAATKATAEGATKEASKKASEEAAKSSQKKTEACVTAGVLALGIALKKNSANKAQAAAKPLCDYVDQLTGRSSTLNSCISKVKLPETSSTGYGVHYYVRDGVNQNAVTAGMPDSLTTPLINSINTANVASKFPASFDLEGLAKKIDDGESVIGALSAAAGGLPSDVVEEIQGFEKRIKAGETIALLGSASGEATMAAIAPLSAMKFGGANAFDEFSMGDGGVTPGTGNGEEMQIQGRAPAGASAGFDGDIYHAGYPGTIFQIVSKKLVDNHPRLEQLEPVLPLNRALSGLKNPPAKTK